MRSSWARPDQGDSGVSAAATARSTPTLTLAATTCPPSRRRISATGRLSSSPPSTSRSPRKGTGGSSPGTEQLTRAQNHAGPRSWNSTRARVRLHDTQRYGVGRSSMARSPNIALSVRIVARPVRSDTKGMVRSFRLEPPTYARRDISSICRSSAPMAHWAARMAPMLVPPTMSMGTPACPQRANHADVREAPGASAAQHQAPRRAGDASNETVVVRRAAGHQVMVRFGRHRVEPDAGVAGRCVGRAHQHELDARALRASLVEFARPLVRGRCRARCRHDQNEIRLREAPASVGGHALVARADHIAVGLLGVGQGGRQPVAIERRIVGRARHGGRAMTGASERLHQVFTKRLEGRLGAGAQHGDGRDRHGPGSGPRRGLLEAVAQRVRQLQGHGPVLRRGIDRHGGGHAHQHGIAARPHVERSGFARGDRPSRRPRRLRQSTPRGLPSRAARACRWRSGPRQIGLVTDAQHHIATLDPHERESSATCDTLASSSEWNNGVEAICSRRRCLTVSATTRARTTGCASQAIARAAQGTTAMVVARLHRLERHRHVDRQPRSANMLPGPSDTTEAVGPAARIRRSEPDTTTASPCRSSSRAKTRSPATRVRSTSAMAKSRTVAESTSVSHGRYSQQPDSSLRVVDLRLSVHIPTRSRQNSQPAPEADQSLRMRAVRARVGLVTRAPTRAPVVDGEVDGSARAP